jgi:UDP-N-acetylmuramate dehydrogenase
MTRRARGPATFERLGGEALASGLDAEIRLDEPMSAHTTLRLGGPADVWASVRTTDALVRLLRGAHEGHVPVTCVGGGSNLLVRDGGIRGLVVNLAGLCRVARADADDPGRLEVEGGAATGRLLRRALDWELGGVEFLAGVPGTVGGGLVMNAGTSLGSFSDVVAEVRSLTRDGTMIVRDHGDCGFRYRGSALPTDETVVGTILRLRPREREAILADVRMLRERRKGREPGGVPTSGSTFKNPPGDSAGRLIDSAGLKGERLGGALVSPVHANWLVVDPGSDPPCTAVDLLGLVELVRARVHEVHGVELELELRVVGEGPDGAARDD